MSTIQIELWCPNCGSDEVFSRYDESKNIIVCICKKCNYTVSLGEFDYLIY